MSDGLIDAPTRQLPAGFRAGNSGLIVPEAQSREREVWLADGEEHKVFERAQRLAQQRGLRMPLVCFHPRCVDNPIACTILKRVEVPGGYELHCEHKVRVCLAKARR